MIVICEKCGSQYEIGDVDEGKVLRCHKCGDMWKHLPHIVSNTLEDEEILEESPEITEASTSKDGKHSSDFLFYVLLIIVLVIAYFMFEKEILALIQSFINRV